MNCVTRRTNISSPDGLQLRQRLQQLETTLIAQRQVPLDPPLFLAQLTPPAPTARPTAALAPRPPPVPPAAPPEEAWWKPWEERFNRHWSGILGTVVFMVGGHHLGAHAVVNVTPLERFFVADAGCRGTGGTGPLSGTASLRAAVRQVAVESGRQPVVAGHLWRRGPAGSSGSTTPNGRLPCCWWDCWSIWGWPTGAPSRPLARSPRSGHRRPGRRPDQLSPGFPFHRLLETPPFAAHVSNWLLMGVGLAVIRGESLWLRALTLAPCAAATFFLAKRAKVLDIRWLHLTDTLVAQGMAIGAILILLELAVTPFGWHFCCWRPCCSCAWSWTRRPCCNGLAS